MKPMWTAWVLAFAACCAVSAQAGEYRGLIEPNRVVKVGSPSEGILATVAVERGDIVQKGQVIATLESRVEKATMNLAKARAEMEGPMRSKEASKNLFNGKKDRVERLYKKQLASPNEMEEANANWLVADMQLKEAMENKNAADLEYKRAAEIVKRLTIASPVQGVVVERMLSPGEYVKDQPIVKLAEIHVLNVEVILPASLYPLVKPGMRATVLPEPPMNGKYTAVVKVVDRVIDGASGTFGVRLQMPNHNYRMPAGLKCKVIFPEK